MNVPDPLYKLVIVRGFGTDELECIGAPSFNSKGQCEVELEKRLNVLRTNAPLRPEGVRFGGACVLMES